MRFIWLDINSSYSHSSLAIPSLDAQLESSIRDRAFWDVVSGTLSANYYEIINKVITRKPDVIFSTFWLFNSHYNLTVLKKLKALIPEVRIIIGGPEFLGDNYHFLLNNPEIEAVVRGDGEILYPKLVNSIINNIPVYKLEGVCTFFEDNYYDNKRAFTDSVSHLKIPEESIYFNYSKPFVQIETSRGCFNTCNFCVSGLKERVTYIDYNSLKGRLDNLKKRGVRHIRILDRTFNAHSQHACELLTIMKQYEGSLSFHIEVHPAFLSDSLKSLLKTIPAGLIHAEVGIQSLNDNVLKTSGRKGSSMRSIEGLRFLKSLGTIEIHTDLIIGLPGYNLNELFNDYKFLVKMDVDEIQVELLKLLPGTEFRINYKKYGLKFSPVPPYEILESDVMTFDQTRKAMILSRFSDLWYNNSEWKYLISLLINNQSEFLDNFIEYISKIDISNISSEKCGLILYNFIKKFLPEYIKDISNLWLKNGYSLNKEPGKIANRFERYYTGIYFPFEKSNFEDYSYYYIDKQNYTYWYSFNKSSKRLKHYISLSKSLNMITESKIFD